MTDAVQIVLLKQCLIVLLFMLTGLLIVSLPVGILNTSQQNLKDAMMEILVLAMDALPVAQLKQLTMDVLTQLELNQIATNFVQTELTTHLEEKNAMIRIKIMGMAAHKIAESKEAISVIIMLQAKKTLVIKFVEMGK